MSLKDKTIASSYIDILQVDNSNAGISTSIKNVKDGIGAITAISVGRDNLYIKPKNADSTAVLNVRDKDNNTIFVVDSDNDLVKASAGQHIVNTQYAHFGILANNSGASGFVADTHHPLVFNGHVALDAGNPLSFGTSADPATSFTVADANGQRAANLVPMMWRVPDNITIDEIKHFEGADTAGIENTQMHLMSYRYTTNQALALDQGAVVANTSAANTSVGATRTYLKDWTIVTPDINAGVVLMAMFECIGTVSADYSVSVTIKYHLR